MAYLGTNLHSSGLHGSELSRRIGLAKLDFKQLSKVWGKGTLSSKRKLQIYKVLVESKLLYGLAACSLNAAQERKLNGLQAWCLRTILGVSRSFESRLSNMGIRRRAACEPATKSLLQQQLVQLGKVIRYTPGSLLYAVSLHPVTRQLKVGHFI